MCVCVCVDSGGVLDVRAILSLLSIPAVAYVVALKTVMGIPAGVFHSMFSVVNIERLGLTPETNGQLLSYIGFITMVSRGLKFLNICDYLVYNIDCGSTYIRTL